MPLFIDIKVFPSSGCQKLVLDKSNILKCYLKNPPEKGKANDELIKFIARKLSLNKQDICIVSGVISRKKRIKINLDITFDQFLHKFGIEKQMTIK